MESPELYKDKLTNKEIEPIMPFNLTMTHMNWKNCISHKKMTNYKRIVALAFKIKSPIIRKNQIHGITRKIAKKTPQMYPFVQHGHIAKQQENPGEAKTVLAD